MVIIERILSIPGVFPALLLVFVVLTSILSHYAKQKLYRIYGVICMCAWGAGILYITWLSRVPIHETRINLKLFSEDSSIFDILTNIMLFIPYPILLDGLSGKRHNVFSLAAAGVGLSLAIEVLQYFTHRGICDINDLILNSMGVMIGASITVLLRKWKNGQPAC